MKNSTAPSSLEIRQEIARLTGFPLASVSATASVSKFAIDTALVGGQRLQSGLSAMAESLALDGVSLFHVRPKGGTRQVGDIRLGTWQHYAMRKIS